MKHLLGPDMMLLRPIQQLVLRQLQLLRQVQLLRGFQLLPR